MFGNSASVVLSFLLLSGCSTALHYIPSQSVPVEQAVRIVRRCLEESDVGQSPNKVAVDEERITIATPTTHRDYLTGSANILFTNEIYHFDSIETEFYPKRVTPNHFLVHVVQSTGTSGRRGFEVLVPNLERAKLLMDALSTLRARALATSPFNSTVTGSVPRRD